MKHLSIALLLMVGCGGEPEDQELSAFDCVQPIGGTVTLNFELKSTCLPYQSHEDCLLGSLACPSRLPARKFTFEEEDLALGSCHLVRGVHIPEGGLLVWVAGLDGASDSPTDRFSWAELYYDNRGCVDDPAHRGSSCAERACDYTTTVIE